MTSRLTVLVQAGTPQQRSGRAALSSDRAEPAMLRRAAGLADRLGRIDQAWCSPSRAAVDTAEAMALDTTCEPALRDLGLGRWAGHDLASIATADPDGFSRWLQTGCADPHGGEPFHALLDRVNRWMIGTGQAGGRHLAIAPAMVARAAIVGCLGGNASALRWVDPDPLSMVRFDGRNGAWTLRAIVPARYSKLSQ